MKKFSTPSPTAEPSFVQMECDIRLSETMDDDDVFAKAGPSQIVIDSIRQFARAAYAVSPLSHLGTIILN